MFAKVIRFFIVVLTVSACTVTSPVGISASSPGTTTGITFIHLNDTYRVDAVEEGRRGGFGRVATLIRELREEGRDVRLLHGGDFLFPSLESQLWSGEQMVEAMNFLSSLAPMYVVPGNHEFDSRTPDTIVQRVRESKFDWLGDNFRLQTGVADVDRYLRSAYTLSTGDKTIGIFALSVHPDHGGNSRDYTPFSSGYIQNAERVIRQFEAAGVDLIIGLTHLHLRSDIEIAKLKRRHPSFEFIVGGHEHEVHFEAGDSDNAMIMKGSSNARVIWRIDVAFSDQSVDVTTHRIDVDETISLDPEYQIIADKWRAKLLDLIPFLPSRIGAAAVPLDGREISVRGGDSNWGMFIADQMRTAFRDPPADFAFVNGGTLRIDDYIAEDITFEDIGRTFGFSSFLRYMTMDGGDFRDTLEAGYRGNGLGKGYFPQISGFRVCVDQDRPDGDRIVQMQVPTNAGWQGIDAEKPYTVVAPDYVYGGGDGYDFSKAREVSRAGSELKFLVLDAVIRAQAAGQKVGADLESVGGRFFMLPEGSDQCFD